MEARPQQYAAEREDDETAGDGVSEEEPRNPHAARRVQRTDFYSCPRISLTIARTIRYPN